ncbi:MAG: substrate-binding domain-containing protein [Lachnospiraceae bacterium]
MKKSLLTGILTVALTAGLLAGCGQSKAAQETGGSTSTAVKEEPQSETAPEESETDAKKETKPYKIAIGLTDSGATMFSLMSNNIKAYMGATGGEVVFQSGVAASADATIQFVENQIAAGVNGILIGPPSDSVLPTVTSLCEEAGVYWGITFRTIMDEEVKELVESSAYYVGNCYEDEYATGYRVMSNMNEQGIKKVAIISQAKGNTTTDLREEGARKACEDFGMEIVAEARDLGQAADATSAAESFLASYSELDAIFIVGTTGTGIHEAVAKAIEDSGRVETVKLATVDFPDAMVELFEKGELVTCSGIPSWGYDPYMITVVLANQCMGNPISEQPVSLTCTMFDINDLETATAWAEKFGKDSTLYYEETVMAETLNKAYNANLTEESIQKAIDEFAADATK